MRRVLDLVSKYYSEFQLKLLHLNFDFDDLLNSYDYKYWFDIFIFIIFYVTLEVIWNVKLPLPDIVNGIKSERVNIRFWEVPIVSVWNNPNVEEL